MHYYKLDGSSCHEVTGKNGQLRPTTVADARKLRLFPSVTTVMQVLDKHMLTSWIIDQILDAAVRTPFHPEEYEAEKWKRGIRTASQKIGKDAAAEGTRVHSVLDKWFKTGKVVKKDSHYVEKCLELLNTTFPGREWISEKSFASEKHGFGGSVDLHCENIIIDFKTKNKEDIYSITAYDENKMQLCAYKEGLELPGNVRLFNMFISTAEEHEGECNLVEVKPKDISKYWNMFYTLTEFWRAKNQYDPRSAP